MLNKLLELQNLVENTNFESDAFFLEKKSILSKIKDLEHSIKRLQSMGTLDFFINRPVITIPPLVAKTLFRKSIKIMNKKTKEEFTVMVDDWCGDDQKGLIVIFSEKDKRKVSKYKKDYRIEPSEDGRLALDLRNIFCTKTNKTQHWVLRG